MYLSSSAMFEDFSKMWGGMQDLGKITFIFIYSKVSTLNIISMKS